MDLFFFLRFIAIFLSFLFYPTIEAANSASDGSAIALIRNNINLYNVLIDRKDYASLDQVFTQDASPDGIAGPNAPYPQNITGIEQFLADALGDITTLHYSDTQYVELGSIGDTATAISYGQAVYFAKDVNVSQQIVTFYGTFLDDFVLQDDKWLVKNKTLSITVYSLFF